ncbi:hypothetical protein EDD17DRAFT_1603677 [Pisolithus thermaeus]|nr:hypothetical protein EV401DRAFT_345106 [Pisolithus croceorrhizus]KAI6160217.1 hypothetical protein EDD17DRAFT_1603677 [Pisolithus thermaeus]
MLLIFLVVIMKVLRWSLSVGVLIAKNVIVYPEVRSHRSDEMIQLRRSLKKSAEKAPFEPLIRTIPLSPPSTATSDALDSRCHSSLSDKRG